MKKNALLVLLLTVLTVSGLGFSHTQRAAAISVGTDTPDDPDGFAADDPCGFVEGTSIAYNSISMNADSVADASQACADASGYFYERDGILVNRDSKIKIVVGTTSYTVDLVGTTGSGSDYQAVVDQTTGRWSGYGYITDASYSGSNRWVWFDWTCVGSDSFSGSDATCGGGISGASYRVKTNLDTGVVSGYAWNDDLGFLSFRNLSMELPPHEIEVYVDVLAGDSELGPDDVDLSSAPLADGYDYWRVRVQFWDASAASFLDDSDFEASTLSLIPTTVGEIFLNQVENTGDPIMISGYNPSLGCSDMSSDYCLINGTDANADGDYDDAGDEPWSMNAFVFSGAPTSNMTGLNTDSDLAFENYTDREGCKWIYRDQWYEVMHSGTALACPAGSGTTYAKSTVFYDRADNRNMVGLETLGMTFVFSSDRTMSVTTSSGTLESIELASSTRYYYYPPYNGDSDGDGIEDGMYLSYRPRFTTTKFVSVYDGNEYTQISSDVTKSMSLSTLSSIATMSSEATAAGVTQIKPGIEINYQAAVDSSNATPTVNDHFLLMDTVDAGVTVDCARRTDTLSAGSYGATGSAVFPLAYGQKDSACQGSAPTAAASNTVSNPTLEQWVCDDVGEYRFGSPACYYTAYLNIVDPHDDPHTMRVLGAINSGLNDETIFTDTEEISVLGSTDTIKLRNKMYSQIVRYMLGESPTGGTLDDSMDPSAGMLELIDGRLIIARGDVTVNGSSAFSDKTLVVLGGDVYIEGNLTNGRLGVIALRDNGIGGNVYVAPIVTELYANFFLDGGFFSYSGDSASISTEGEPTWVNDETRMATLLNQLYLNGSLVSRNTVNGSTGSEGSDGVTYYDVGDGTLTSSYTVAREHDLNLIRQYRLCYPLLSTGLPDTSADPDVCNSGEELSSYGEANADYSSFILEYAPADSLPIFRSQNGLFN